MKQRKTPNPPKIGAKKRPVKGAKTSKGSKARKTSKARNASKGVATASKPTGVPGYGPAKLRRVTRELQRQYGELTEMRSQLRWLERKGLAQGQHLSDIERQRAAYKRVLDKLANQGSTTFAQDIRHIPPGIEGKDMLSANDHELARQLKRKHGLSSLRHVYSLFFSP